MINEKILTESEVKLNSLEIFKLISVAFIFEEPKYYRAGWLSQKFNSDIINFIPLKFSEEDTLTDVMLKAINDALNCDFLKTIEWARTLRQEADMKVTPQVIMVMASLHPKRIEFNKKQPNVFRNINNEVMVKADEPIIQLSFYLWYNGRKNNIPSILKCSWKNKLENLSEYELSKYRASEVGMINLVRICHANNEKIDNLLRNQIKKIKKENDEKFINNIEYITSKVKRKKDIIKILEELEKEAEIKKILPLVYYKKYKNLKFEDINNKEEVIDTLNKCFSIALKKILKLNKKKLLFLADNTRDNWKLTNEKERFITNSDINIFDSIVGYLSSEEAEIYKYGNDILPISIDRHSTVISQIEKLTFDKYTEKKSNDTDKITKFFEEIIECRINYKYICVYSCKPINVEGLYRLKHYYSIEEAYEDGGIIALIRLYKERVNPNVKIFYINTFSEKEVIQKLISKGAIIQGGTGRELLYIKMIIDIWDDVEARIRKEAILKEQLDKQRNGFDV